jgi:Flavodoxin domain
MALDHDSLHELWRMQLLDELRRRRVALEYEPQLDPEGRRRDALAVLIASVEDAQIEALEELNGKEEAPAGAPPRKGDVMRPSILVAYASKRGSTAEVAASVGKRLRERGLAVDVRKATEVEDLASYDGVVVGGSLYFGRWHDDARAFLNRFGRRSPTGRSPSSRWGRRPPRRTTWRSRAPSSTARSAMSSPPRSQSSAA